MQPIAEAAFGKHRTLLLPGSSRRVNEMGTILTAMRLPPRVSQRAGSRRPELPRHTGHQHQRDARYSLPGWKVAMQATHYFVRLAATMGVMTECYASDRGKRGY